MSGLDEEWADRHLTCRPFTDPTPIYRQNVPSALSISVGFFAAIAKLEHMIVLRISGGSSPGGNQSQPAFTLVEMLVVMGIVSVLAALMTASLANARSTARGIGCQLNLKQMIDGWLAYMHNASVVIPYTRNTQFHPNWEYALNSVLNTEIVFISDEPGKRTFAGCPELLAQYRPMTFKTRWGYAVNTIWNASTGELNEQKPWVAVRRPSDYPWFLDPQPYKYGAGYNVAHRVPYNLMGAPDWGIGANHGLGTPKTHANIAYADASVRSVPIAEPRNAGMRGGDFTWLSNQ